MRGAICNLFERNWPTRLSLARWKVTKVKSIHILYIKHTNWAIKKFGGSFSLFHCPVGVRCVVYPAGCEWAEFKIHLMLLCLCPLARFFALSPQWPRCVQPWASESDAETPAGAHCAHLWESKMMKFCSDVEKFMRPTPSRKSDWREKETKRTPSHAKIEKRYTISYVPVNDTEWVDPYLKKYSYLF